MNIDLYEDVRNIDKLQTLIIKIQALQLLGREVPVNLMAELEETYNTVFEE